MISRLLMISLLNLGLSTITTRAITTISTQDAISSVSQPNLEPASQPQTASSDGANQQVFLGVLAICLLGTPILGRAVYKQHFVYRKAIQHNQVESLERIWQLPSKIR